MTSYLLLVVALLLVGFTRQWFWWYTRIEQRQEELEDLLWQVKQQVGEEPEDPSP